MVEQDIVRIKKACDVADVKRIDHRDLYLQSGPLSDLLDSFKVVLRDVHRSQGSMVDKLDEVTHSHEELQKLSHDLVLLYHNARRGITPFDISLERFILTLR